MGIAGLDAGTGVLTYAGIGNTRAAIVRAHADSIIRLGSDYGVVGGSYRRLSPEQAPLDPGDVLVLYTDGIPEMIDIPRTGEARQLAAMIVQRWGKMVGDKAALVFIHEEAK